MNTLTSVCRKQVRRSIWTFYVPVDFRHENGVLFVREFEDMTVVLN